MRVIYSPYPPHSLLTTIHAALGTRMHSGPHTKSMHLQHGRPSSAHACQLTTFLIVTDMYIHHVHTYIIFLCQPADVRGCNIYGVLRAGRSSSAESLVFSAPYPSPREASNLHGLAVMLSLAEYFKSEFYDYCL